MSITEMPVDRSAAPAGSISGPALAALRAKLRGELIQAGDAGYDDARAVYNAMHDRYPALVVRAAEVGDVVATLALAGDEGLALSVRGGGHSVAGFGTNDGGIVLDLSRLRSVDVDPASRVARVGGGATWGEVDGATGAFELATPSGIISTTGVAGLTLGGGFGYLSRRWGLASDNLRAADVVTADGRLVRASTEENADLFWAIRGGGGNFGVVTSFEFNLHPVGTVYGGPIFYPADRGGDVLGFYRDFIAGAPRELSAFFGYHIAPPAPFVPERLHGAVVCAIVVCWTGPLEQAEAALRPIREAAPVALDLMGPLPYPALNGMFDALLPAGLQHYWKADFVGNLSDAAITVHTEYGPQVPNVQSLMHIYPMDGAVADVPTDATAYSYRDVKFIHNIVGIDPEPAQMPARTRWVRDYWSALHPLSAGGAYVNFMMDEGQDRVRATYRDNYPRLTEVKRRWDPGNLFRMNQNIRPAS